MSHSVAYTPRAVDELRGLLASMDSEHRRERLGQELADLLDRLADAPRIAPPYLPLTSRGVRRALLRRSQVHVYHRVDDDPPRVVILALWPAVRRDPEL